jgi:hypothetical protein
MIRRRRRNQPMAISEAELAAMTADMDDMHHASMPSVRAAIAEWQDLSRDVASNLAQTDTTRRRFLLGAGVIAGGVALAACGSSSKSSSSTPTTASSGTTAAGGSPTGLTGDLAVVALAASLENLAVDTYNSGISAAQAGKLGSVPPAVVTFAQTAMSQHKDHAAAWNAVLTGAGKSPVTGVDMTVKTGVVDPAFAQVNDVTGLAKLALELENVAAQTYLSAIGAVTSPAGIKTAASIEPVELQHAAILNFVLGTYPVPDSFTKTDAARTTSDKVA